MKSIDFLRTEYNKRLIKNPAYSLNSFARDIKISPSYLHRILNFEKFLSEEKGHQIAQILKWNDNDSKIFLTLLRYEKCKDPQMAMDIKEHLKTILAKETYHLFLLNDDAFNLINEWYHGALLEIIELNELEHSERIFARKLGIPEIKISLALERLIRLGLIIKRKDGKYIKNNKLITVPEGPSYAKRSYHQQMLEKAKEALVKQTINERSITGITLAVNKDEIPKAKRLIQEFRRKFHAELQSHDQKNAVYHLSLEYFRLDKEIT